MAMMGFILELVGWLVGLSREASLATVVYTVPPFPYMLPSPPPSPFPSGVWVALEGLLLPNVYGGAVPLWGGSIGGGGSASYQSTLRIDFTVHLYRGVYTRYWRGPLPDTHRVHTQGLSWAFQGSWMVPLPEPVLEIGVGTGRAIQQFPLQNENYVYTTPTLPYSEAFMGIGLPGRVWVRVWMRGGWVGESVRGVSATAWITRGLALGGGLAWGRGIHGQPPSLRAGLRYEFATAFSPWRSGYEPSTREGD